MLNSVRKILAVSCIAVALTSCGDDAKTTKAQDNAPPKVVLPVNPNLNPRVVAETFGQDLVDICMNTGMRQQQIAAIMTQRGAAQTTNAAGAQAWTYNVAGQETQLGSTTTPEGCGMSTLNVDLDKAVDKIVELTGASPELGPKVMGDNIKVMSARIGDVQYRISASKPIITGDAFTINVSKVTPQG